MEKTGLKVPFSVPSLNHEEEEAVLRVMRSGWITTGKETLEFEKEFSEKINSRHCLAVNSATSGLMLAMDACGIKEGCKILTTPYTFASTALAARHLRGDIEYADIEEDTYNISPEEIERKLSLDKERKIKAVVPVHIAGNLCRMDEIKQIAEKYGVYVIEDAAHAFPSKTQKGYAGTLSDIGVFSFYATKTMTTAEGGMVATDNDDFAKRMTTMRMHGIDRNVWDRYTSSKASWEYDVVDEGYKFNLPDILSCIGRVQLKKADSFLERRSRIVKRYNEEFSKYDFLKIPPTGEGDAMHLYLLRFNLDKINVSRNEISSLLQQAGLGISMHFIPHFKMSYFKNRYNLSEKDFPNALKQFESTLTLPLWPDMTEDMVQYVIDVVINTCKNHLR